MVVDVVELFQPEQDCQSMYSRAVILTWTAWYTELMQISCADFGRNEVLPMLGGCIALNLSNCTHGKTMRRRALRSSIPCDLFLTHGHAEKRQDCACLVSR